MDDSDDIFGSLGSVVFQFVSTLPVVFLLLAFCLFVVFLILVVCPLLIHIVVSLSAILPQLIL